MLGDYDPGGWLAGRIFAEHLARYNFPCPTGPQYLVRPELFTPEELKLYSRPLGSREAGLDQWLAESGGIGGQARGIHADWLQPASRLISAIQQRLHS